MKFRSIILAAACSALTFVSIGCQGPDLMKAPQTASNDPIAGAYPEIVMLDGMERSLVKGAPNVKRPPDSSTLSIIVPIRSITDGPVRFKWQVVFFDSDGHQLTDNPVWHEEILQPTAMRNIEARAMSDKAVKWNLTIAAK